MFTVTDSLSWVCRGQPGSGLGIFNLAFGATTAKVSTHDGSRGTVMTMSQVYEEGNSEKEQDARHYV